jgi:hypothetical protein
MLGEFIEEVFDGYLDTPPHPQKSVGRKEPRPLSAKSPSRFDFSFDPFIPEIDLDQDCLLAKPGPPAATFPLDWTPPTYFIPARDQPTLNELSSLMNSVALSAEEVVPLIPGIQNLCIMGRQSLKTEPSLSVGGRVLKGTPCKSRYLIA